MDVQYSLRVDGSLIGDFHDWPLVWDRGEESSGDAAPPGIIVKKPQAEAASLLTRYQSGEFQQVWSDLVALGDAIRSPEYFGPAMSVARETMRRTRHNLDLIAARLLEMGYRFWSPGESAPAPPTGKEYRTKLESTAQRILEQRPAAEPSVDPRQAEHWRQTRAAIDPAAISAFAGRASALYEKFARTSN